MWHSLLDTIEGFWTYQTPISFLAGIGVYHLYCKVRHRDVYGDEDTDVQGE